MAYQGHLQYSFAAIILMFTFVLFILWAQSVGAQPTLVRDINPLPAGASPREFVAIGNVVYFVAANSGQGQELWRSDGTVAGTVLVKDIVPGNGGSFPSDLTDVNGVLYFGATSGVTGRELWRSTGKDIQLGSGHSRPADLTNVNGVLYFGADNNIHGRELWRLAPCNGEWGNRKREVVKLLVVLSN